MIVNKVLYSIKVLFTNAQSSRIQLDLNLDFSLPRQMPTKSKMTPPQDFKSRVQHP